MVKPPYDDDSDSNPEDTPHTFPFSAASAGFVEEAELDVDLNLDLN